jgi:hypothetical protein
MVHVFRTCFFLRSLFAAASTAAADHDFPCYSGWGDYECDPDICNVAFEARCNKTHLFVDLTNGSQTTLETLASTWVHSELKSLDIYLVSSSNDRKPMVNARGFRTLSEALPGNLESLTVWLRRTQLRGKQVKALAAALSANVTKLHSLVLNIEGTSVTNADIERLALALPSTLKTLVLNICRRLKLTDDSIIAVSHAVRRMTELRTLELNLKGTRVTQYGIKEVTSAALGCEQLHTLILNARNTLGADKSINAVFDAVSTYPTKLTRLALDFGKNREVTDASINMIRVKAPFPESLSNLRLLVDRTQVTRDSLKLLRIRMWESDTWFKVSIWPAKLYSELQAYRYDNWTRLDGHFCLGPCETRFSKTSAASASLVSTASSATQIATTPPPTLTVLP